MDKSPGEGDDDHDDDDHDDDGRDDHEHGDADKDWIEDKDDIEAHGRCVRCG